MTRFESVGVDLQETAVTVEQAKRSFRYSCKLCCEHGLRIKCDSCAIAEANKNRISDLMEEQAERLKKESIACEAAKSRSRIIIIL